MKLKFLITTIAIIGLLTGCVGLQTQNISRYDKFQGVAINQILNNDLPVTPLIDDRTIYLDPRQEIKANSETNYFVVLRTIGAKIGPQPGESLIFLADGKRLGLSQMLNWDFSQGVFYQASEEIFRTIAQSTNVEVRILSFWGHVDKKFSQKNLDNYRTFVAAYIDHNIESVPVTKPTSEAAKLNSPKGL